MLEVTNEFLIKVKGGRVIADWTPQLVVDTGLYSYINPSLGSPSYICKIGVGNDPALPTDTNIDGIIATSDTKTTPKTEYRSAIGKATVVMAFDIPAFSERVLFNQIGMYVNGTLFSKLVYTNPIFLLPGETIEILYRISLVVDKEPTVTVDPELGFFTYRVLPANFTSSSSWSALPKGMAIVNAGLSFSKFSADTTLAYRSDVNATSVSLHSTAPTSVTYKLSWNHTVGAGTYYTIWARSADGRTFQIGFPDDRGMFKNEFNSYSCLLTINMKRANQI